MSNVSFPKFQFRGSTQSERDKELVDYLFKLTEEVEDSLENIGSENLSAELYNKLVTIANATSSLVENTTQKVPYPATYKRDLAMNKDVTIEDDGFVLIYPSLGIGSSGPISTPCKAYIGGKLVATADFGVTVTVPVYAGDKFSYTSNYGCVATYQKRIDMNGG